MAELSVESGMTVEVDPFGHDVEVETPSWQFEVTAPAWTFNVVTPNTTAALGTATDVDVLLVPGPPGPEGPVGPEGPPGSGVEQLFVVSVPGVLWQLSHSLGRWVDVQAFDSNGEEIFGDVTLLDGLVEIRWYYPTAGSARVST